MASNQCIFRTNQKEDLCCAGYASGIGKTVDFCSLKEKEEHVYESLQIKIYGNCKSRSRPLDFNSKDNRELCQHNYRSRAVFTVIIKSSSATGFFIISFVVLTSGSILTSSGTASKADTKSILILLLMAFNL